MKKVWKSGMENQKSNKNNGGVGGLEQLKGFEG
jgi:hypothetical protein